MRNLRCPKCESGMEGGFVVDRSHNQRAALPVWTEGEPERSFFTGLKVRGRKRYTVLTARCRKCGYLESYANDPVGR